MIEFAFTTRIPLAVMIAMGIKQWENRAAMPELISGRCAMTCSKSSGSREYANFLAWAERVFKPEAIAALPAWERVEGWRGKLVAVCDYEASYTAPNPPVWNESYPAWWHLSNVRLLDDPIPCRGNVGMWRLPEDVKQRINLK
ncbi:MAG: hypothetical protein IKR81_12080 [Victivallales bacterium]|jgi:hypothetical protein|nr:hypothetical protein [Victivallales bacterium]